MLLPAFTQKPESHSACLPSTGAIFVPPDGFEEVSEVLNAQFCGGTDAFRISDGGRADTRLALRAGKKYEQRCHEVLSRQWENLGSYLPGPWISFHDQNRKRRLCQPDALFIRSDGSVLIVEMKLTHTLNAWWQLRRLYQPVVERLYNREAFVLEVCRTGDPLMRYPEPVELYERVEDLKHDAKFNMLILKA